MVNNHGDGFSSPKDRVVGPLPSKCPPLLAEINGGYESLTIPGMILQVRTPSNLPPPKKKTNSEGVGGQQKNLKFDLG